MSIKDKLVKPDCPWTVIVIAVMWIIGACAEFYMGYFYISNNIVYDSSMAVQPTSFKTYGIVMMFMAIVNLLLALLTLRGVKVVFYILVILYAWNLVRAFLTINGSGFFIAIILLCLLFHSATRTYFGIGKNRTK